MAEPVDPERPMDGIRTWRTVKNWCVFEVHYTADPDKRTPEWKAKALNSMPDLQSFNREFEIDWTSTTGLPFYPLMYKKYVEDRGYYIRVQEVPNGVLLYRGFDFGFHRPACVFAFQDATGTLRVLREFCPKEIDVYEFRDAVKFISGELEEIPPKHTRALAWCERVAPDGPWFENGTKFLNFCGVEAKKIQTMTGDYGELNDFDVFQGGGVALSIVNQRVSAGTYILRNLMKDFGGSPRILIDPRCTTLIAGMSGGLTFGEGNKASPLDDEIAIHPEYSHIHDALRYLVTGIINVSDIQTRLNEGFPDGKAKAPVDPRRAEPPRYGPSDSNKWEDAPFYAQPDDVE